MSTSKSLCFCTWRRLFDCKSTHVQSNTRHHQPADVWITLWSLHYDWHEIPSVKIKKTMKYLKRLNMFRVNLYASVRDWDCTLYDCTSTHIQSNIESPTTSWRVNHDYFYLMTMKSSASRDKRESLKGRNLSCPSDISLFLYVTETVLCTLTHIRSNTKYQQPADVSIKLEVVTVTR